MSRRAELALRQPAGVPVLAVTPQQLFEELDMLGAVKLTGYFNSKVGGVLW